MFYYFFIFNHIFIQLIDNKWKYNQLSKQLLIAALFYFY